MLQEFRAEQVLMATGRTPNIAALRLSEAGIETDAHGFIVVDNFVQKQAGNLRRRRRESP